MFNFALLGYAPTGLRNLPAPHAWVMVAWGMVVLVTMLEKFSN